MTVCGPFYQCWVRERIWGHSGVLRFLQTGEWMLCSSRTSPVACAAGPLSGGKRKRISFVLSSSGYAVHTSTVRVQVASRWSGRNDICLGRIWCQRRRRLSKPFAGVLVVTVAGRSKLCCSLVSRRCRRGPPATVDPLPPRPQSFGIAQVRFSSRIADACTDTAPYYHYRGATVHACYSAGSSPDLKVSTWLLWFLHPKPSAAVPAGGPWLFLL